MILKYIYLADILLRATLNLATPSDPPEEVFHFNSEDTLQMFQVDLETLELDNPDIYPSTLEEINAETEVEPNLSVLCAFVAHTWPSNNRCP